MRYIFMRKLTQQEVNEIIAKHLKWLRKENDGERADFSNTDLSYIDFSYRNLSRSIFYHANLYKTNFYKADLFRSNLCGADFSKANLSRSNLAGSIISYANFSYASLFKANISCVIFYKVIIYNTCLNGANFSCSSFQNINFNKANLFGANLSSTVILDSDLSEVNLSFANLAKADLSHSELKNIKYDENTAFFTQSCPEEGSFIGFKKCKDYIVKLLITEDAKRSSATSRKCRCSKAKVLSITNLDGSDSELSEISSNRDSNFIYKIGEVIEVKDFDENRFNECSIGIHFFITRDEAVRYQG